MRVIADLHVHSKYAMATSRSTDLEHLAAGAKAKGIGLLGTGDFTHPKWFSEIRAKLEPSQGAGIYSYQGMDWLLSCEVSTVYQKAGKARKIHHLIYAPDFDVVSQINDVLSTRGNLSSDGRPTLTGIDSAELVDVLCSITRRVVVIPAHAWTPWFGVFGSKSGFESLEECYEDRVKEIFAIETGLSSDPPMNWRLSALDKIALVSNSDAHSPNPWRLGREANAFDLSRVTYADVFDAIKQKDRTRFLFTLEVDPAYGKYHFTGHEACRVSFSPGEAKALQNRCPRCGKKLTIGVLQRVDTLGDRPEGHVPAGAIPFKRLLPLYEVISYSTGVKRLYAKSVIDLQNKLTERFGNEFAVLLDIPEEALVHVVPSRVARAIVANREGRVKVIPGYDGVYGIPVFTE